jgi:SAM-dependent methyltransferase
MSDESRRDAAYPELPMADVLVPMVQSAALIAAGQLGLFEALAEKPLTLEELAASLSCDQRGVRDLANCLVGSGYLLREGERYSNAPHTQRWFTSRGQIDYTPGLRWSGLSWQLLGGLADSVRRGGPATMLWDLMEQKPEWGPTFSRYMEAFARHLGPDLVANVALPASARRLLDLGGSHGLHSIAFCRAHPELSAVLIDHASALTETGATIANAGMRERITLRAGDLRDADWGSDYDVVLLLSVAHNQTAADNADLISRISRALRPGGMLVIHEYLVDAPISAYGAAFQLALLSETGTQQWTSTDFAGWLSNAGFHPPELIKLTPADKGTLLLAKRR